jgi:uncharacterized membrane protein (UPF0127 family)
MAADVRIVLCVAVSLSLAAAAACDSTEAPPSPTPVNTAAGDCGRDPSLPIVRVTFEGGYVDADVARSAQERAQGLSGRACLPEDAGMILDAGTVYVPSIWMRGMLFPLDLVWIGADGRVAAVTAGVQPEPGVPVAELRRYSPPQTVRYTLEINAGAAARLGLTPGVEVTLDPQE